MIVIKCKEDISTARLPPHIAQFADKIMSGILRTNPDYSPSDDGFIVIVTPKDMDATLGLELGARYTDNMWQGVSYNKEYRCYHGVLTTNNQFTLSLLVSYPDSRIDPAIVERMIRETS